MEQASDYLKRLLSVDLNESEADHDSHKLVSAASLNLLNKAQNGSDYLHQPSGTVGLAETAVQRSSPGSTLDSIPLRNATHPSQLDPSYSLSMPLDSALQSQTTATDSSTWQPGNDGCVMPSDPTAMIPPQALLPRAPVVLSYTMDEPYAFTNQYGCSTASMELAANFTGYQ